MHTVCVDRRAGSSTRTTDKPGHPPGFLSERAGTANTIGCVACAAGTFDDDVFYLFLQKQKIGAELHIYTLRKVRTMRLFRGPNTNDMKKWDGPSLSWRGVAKKRTFFFQRDFTCVLNPSFFWGVQMEFSIQNEINSFHLFCNTIRLL